MTPANVEYESPDQPKSRSTPEQLRSRCRSTPLPQGQSSTSRGVETPNHGFPEQLPCRILTDAE